MIDTVLMVSHKCSKKGANDMVPIVVKVTIRRRAYYISTGVKVLKRNFAGGSVFGQVDAPELNQRLQTIYTRIQALLNEYIDAGKEIDVADIRRRAYITVQNSDEDALLTWIDEQIPLLDLKADTRKHYKTLLTRMREWGKMRSWNDITVENIYMFDAWLHTITKPMSRNEAGEPELISDSGVYNYHKCLKALLNRAKEFGKIGDSPYNSLRGKFRRGDKENVEYLTEEEMEAFVNINPPQGSLMAHAHDLFVFQMYTGMSYSDTQAFDFSVYKKVNGKYMCINERVKTGVVYVNQLLPPALEVLEKYGWNTPKIDNQKYNMCLKALGMVAGITQKMHSHLARHTFATWMLANGVPLEHVSKMIGHTNIVQTQRYAKVMATAVYDDFDRVGEKLKDKNKRRV